MQTKRPKIKQITSVLVVDAIEPALALWEDQLGFERVVEVEHEGRLGFVILRRDGSQVMIQTQASLKVDLPAVAETRSTSVLYVDVDSIANAASAIEGAKVVVPERTTFYGAREIWVLDPAGQVVGFSQHDR